MKNIMNWLRYFERLRNIMANENKIQVVRGTTGPSRKSCFSRTAQSATADLRLLATWVAVALQFSYVSAAPSKEIVNADNPEALIQKKPAQMAANKASSTGNEDCFFHASLKRKAEFFKCYYLKPKDKNLLLLGMLNYDKSAEYLIRTMNELPGFKLTVAVKAITLQKNMHNSTLS